MSASITPGETSITPASKPLPRFSQVALGMNAADKARKKRLVPSTELTDQEVRMLDRVWDNLVNDNFVRSLQQLQQLMLTLQIPSQPLSDRIIANSFEQTKGRFSKPDLVNVLEKCKTIHSKWLYKIRGKKLDDDLLEAFVAVGGGEDSGGEVDVKKMKKVVTEFQLQVDLDAIVAELDSDGNADIDFGEFAEMLREEQQSRAAGGDDENDDSLMDATASGGLGETGGDLSGSKQNHEVCLSTMITMNDEEDVFNVDAAMVASPKFVGDDTHGMSHTTGLNASSRRRRSLNSSRRESDALDSGRLPPINQRNGVASSHAVSNSSSTMTAYYKGGGGLRSISPDGRTRRIVGRGRASPPPKSRSPSPDLGKSGKPKKHKFAT